MKSALSIQHPIMSKRGSANGAKKETISVVRERTPLCIRRKKISTKSMYQRALFFGMSPKITPHAKACAIDAGEAFELKARMNFTIAVNIIYIIAQGAQKCT